MSHAPSRALSNHRSHLSMAAGGLCAALLCVTQLGTVHAQDSADTSTIDNLQILDPITVTAARRTQTLNDAGQQIQVVTAKELYRKLPRTLPESLDQLPSILVQKTASGHGSPYIRGFTGNRTLAIIDGIRYNNATYRDGPNEYFSHIDSFTVDQIEVLYGPTSALYGSEGIGGTINVQTRAAAYRDRQPKRFSSAEQVVRVSSGDDSTVSRTAFEIGEGQRWGARFGVSAKKFGDVRAADLGKLLETGYSELAYDGRLDIDLNDTLALTLLHQSLMQDDVPRTHSTVFSVPFAGTESGTDLRRTKDQKRSLSYVKVRGEGIHSPILDEIELTLSNQPRRESEIRIRGDSVRINQIFESDLWAINSVFAKDLVNADLVYGVDYSHETIASGRTDFDPISENTERRIQGPVGDDSKYEQIGVFSNLILPITADWEIDLGGRYSYVRADIGRFEDPVSNEARAFRDKWDNISFSARVSFAHSENSRAWGSIGQAFRAPNIADLSRFGRSRSDEFEVAALNLEPETFLNYEIGYRWSKAPFSITAVAYETQLDNFIDTIATGRIVGGLTEVSKANSASGTIQGIELSGRYQFNDQFSLGGNVSWTEGQLSRPTGIDSRLIVIEPISRIQPVTAHLDLDWNSDPFWASLSLTHAARQDRLSEGDRNDTQRIPPNGTPAFSIINLNSGWKISSHADIGLSLNNLLNEAYRSHGSGSNEPGRHITANIRVIF